MWLANRPHVNPRQARAWYSQVMARPLAPQIRVFSGNVSQSAIQNHDGRLVLEHYDRLSFELSRLIENHLESGIQDAQAFIELIERCERVNITTDEENHRVQDTKGDYQAANIQLVEWTNVPREVREFLWQTKLRGKVCNAKAFAPTAVA